MNLGDSPGGHCTPSQNQWLPKAHPLPSPLQRASHGQPDQACDKDQGLWERGQQITALKRQG
jgi:hypothetical protein